MGRWEQHETQFCTEGGVFISHMHSQDDYSVVAAHNSDCDAYESRIAELECRLARIAALVKPVPVAELVEAGTEAPALLAERHRQIRAILEDEG